MTFVPLAAYRPDVAHLNSEYAADVVGALRAAGFYIPFPQLEPFTDAVAAQPVGGITAEDADGLKHFFVGTATDLYKLNTTTLAWASVTRTVGGDYSATVDERWRFKQFGNFVVAVNINNAPQVYELNVSTNFAALGGSPPNARHIAVWGDQLALFDDDTAYWSDTDDITNWSTLNSGSQVFPDGGNIAGSTDATNPIIFQKSAIRFAQFVPGSLEVFTFTKIHERRGCAAPYSLASRGEFTFFADAGGFFQITSGGQILPIGKEKVDRTVFSEVEGDSLASIYGEIDPFHSRVYWAVRVDSTSDNFDRIYVYDWDIEEFSRVDASTGILFPLGAGTIGYTLEGLDAISASIDALEFSLDSNVWKGGSPVMAAFDGDFKLGFFAGPNAEATFTTQEVGNTAGQLTMVSSLYPVVDNDNSKVTIGTRMKRGASVIFTSELTPSSVTGRVDKLSTSRFHRFIIRVPAGEVWSAAQGIDIESQPAGYR